MASTSMAAWLSRSFLYPFIKSFEGRKKKKINPKLRILAEMLPQVVSTGKTPGTHPYIFSEVILLYSSTSVQQHSDHPLPYLPYLQYLPVDY